MTPEARALLHQGTVIPAHPLALTEDRRLDERHQRALTRYYIAAGAGGVAIGVHTTQFAIREPHVNLLEPVLRLGAEECQSVVKTRPFLRVAGIVGPTDQALREAELARELGYDLGLVSAGGLNGWSDDALLERMRRIARVIPVFAFYLQPAVGGRPLDFSFWRRLCAIDGVEAIKIAPFNRYQTLDVVRAVCLSERAEEIALYTGNDDHLILDLVLPYRFAAGGRMVQKRIVGGLLGHWAVWTHRAVELFAEICRWRDSEQAVSVALVERAMEVTDANAAIFDASNGFRGCIPGIEEVLRRQGLLAGRWCLDPAEDLSPGQNEEIDRIIRSYPHLQDDDFVRAHLSQWLA